MPGLHPEQAEAIAPAREAVRQRLGSTLAEKATDAFCLSYAATGARQLGAARLMAAGLESVSLPGLSVALPGLERQHAVIELRAPEPENLSSEAVKAVLARQQDWKAVTAALESIGKEARPAEEALALWARQNAVHAERDRFYNEMGGLRDEVERGTSALAAGGGERPRIGIAAAPVQACWLNNTIRAETPASVLGDVAEHRRVERIDVPRRLEAEAVDVTVESAATLRAQKQIGGAGVLVGVIDSEVQADHPALGGRVVHRRNYTQEPFGIPDSHGTAVAGLIGAAADFTGMAPEARIYNYKVLATQSALNSTDFEGGLAIQHALEDGVRVVNCSWGSGPAGDGGGREARACDTAWRLGMVIVKSAGNNGPGARTLTTPADAEGVLVVGATSADGTAVPDYSSRGPTPNGRRRPHVLAPGGEFSAPIDGIVLGGGTGTLADVGTSFAAPHVTGLVALLIESEPKLTPDQVRDRVIKTCQRLGGVDADTQGAGLVTPAAL